MTLEAGAVLPSVAVRLVRPLARGGMGSVWEGVREADGLRVAVKLPLADLPSGLASGSFEDGARRLADEALAARRAASLAPHPHVVALLASGVEPGLGAVLVYEYCGGGTLRDELQRRAGARWPEALEAVGAPLLGALDALHRAGVVHRDVKPENLLRDDAGTWKLGDLGLALFEGRDARTATGVVVGTPAYLAPEVFTSATGRGDERADLYAAAVLLVECVIGRNPWSRRSAAETVQAHLRGGLAAADLARLGVPSGAAGVLARALALDPAARPASAGELLAALRGAAEAAATTEGGRRSTATKAVRPGRSSASATSAVRPPPVSPPRDLLAPRAPRARALAAAVALAVAVGLLAWLASGPGPSAPGRLAGPGLFAAAREFALLPDGFVLTLPADAAHAPRWQLRTGPPGGPAAGAPFERAGGFWRAAVSGLAPGASGASAVLEVLDGEAMVASTPLTLPVDALAEPPRVRFGDAALHLEWRLHGRAGVDVEVSQGGQASPLRAHLAATSWRTPRDALDPKLPVSYRLSLAGRTLARGEGWLGLRERLRLDELGGAGRGAFRWVLGGPGAGLVVGLVDGFVASLDPTETSTGLRWRLAWAMACLEACQLRDGDRNLRPAAVDAAGGVLVLAAASRSPLNLVRLAPEVRRSLWRRAAASAPSSPTSSLAVNPDVDRLDQGAGEWLLPLDGSTETTQGCRLADGTLLLVHGAYPDEGGWEAVAVAPDGACQGPPTRFEGEALHTAAAAGASVVVARTRGGRMLLACGAPVLGRLRLGADVALETGGDVHPQAREAATVAVASDGRAAAATWRSWVLRFEPGADGGMGAVRRWRLPPGRTAEGAAFTDDGRLAVVALEVVAAAGGGPTMGTTFRATLLVWAPGAAGPAPSEEVLLPELIARTRRPPGTEPRVLIRGPSLLCDMGWDVVSLRDEEGWRVAGRQFGSQVIRSTALVGNAFLCVRTGHDAIIGLDLLPPQPTSK